MNIILKTSLKNIFGKFFRTLLVTFSIFMCCICAMLCFDLGDSLGNFITNYMRSVSRADFMAYAGGSDLSELPEDFPEADYMRATVNNELFYKPIDGEYCYVKIEYLNIYGLDVDEAVDLEFMKKVDIADGEMYISKEFSEDYGFNVGDKIVVHDRADEEIELTVAGIFPDDMKNPILTGNSGIVNLNTSDLLSCGYREADIVLIDVKDDSKIKEAEDILKAAHPDVSVTELFLSESENSMLGEIKAVFYLLFAITFLLVIFVTASICNRIVSERMSFIGTLRSLGMSTGRTTRILLLENVLYALMGSIPAVILYGLIRDPMLTAFLGLDSSDVMSRFEIPKLSIGLVIGVIVMAIMIECLIPLKAILKALKTSIRDIIFDNRDTEYRYGKSAFVVGLIFLGIAVLTFFFRSIILCAILCLVSAVVAVALLFPRLLRLVAKGIKAFADKHNMPAWSLAATQASTKKSTVSSGVLSATAAAMCIVVYAVSTAMGLSINDIPYDCDVIASTSNQMKYYAYVEHLDTVTEVEPLYYIAEQFRIENDTIDTTGYFYALPDDGFDAFTGFGDLAHLEDGCVYIDKKLANRKGVSEGDDFNITLNPNGAFPIERNYKVQGIIDSNAADGGVEAIIITENEYKTLFLDYPGELLIRCDDPELVRDTIETYAKDSIMEVKTRDEYAEQIKDSNKQSTAVVTIIIVIALGMTAIGMISNQLIGFEGRKKECAVMLSTAMSKGKLSGILLKEVLITSFTASAIGTAVGTILCAVLREAMMNTETLVMDIPVDIPTNLLFLVILTAVFTLTVLFPIKNLRKMKISEQIKYE